MQVSFGLSGSLLILQWKPPHLFAHYFVLLLFHFPVREPTKLLLANLSHARQVDADSLNII